MSRLVYSQTRSKLARQRTLAQINQIARRPRRDRQKEENEGSRDYLVQYSGIFSRFSGYKMKTVCLFVKSPRLGEAKTRLARDIGAARAAVIYRALVEHQAAEIPVDWRVAVYFAPSNAGEDMKTWLGPPAVLRPTLAAGADKLCLSVFSGCWWTSTMPPVSNDQSKISFLRESCQPS